MKCVKSIPSGTEVFRTSSAHAALLTGWLKGINGIAGMPEYAYASKAEWKAGGRKRSGPQDHAPNSVHPRKGWANREKKGRWER